ncbi:MAG TPA: hypothetical protein VF062_18585 [Candidatus Limnocylindrales bacterium]
MTVSPNWTPPEPPRPADGKQPIRPGRMWTGIGLALGAHLLTILVGWIVALTMSGEAAFTFLTVAAIGQVVLAIAALVAGTILAVRGRDGGIGLGIIIGWAVGMIISPVIGFGVCVSLVDSQGMFG